jgi:hypothetical protein
MIREQGPPGAGGAPGGIPVFQIGVVISGPVPSVTVVQVNPLLYTLNFVIPSANTSFANTWIEVQTFQSKAVFNAGFTAIGSSTIEDLTVQTLTVAGAGTFVGLQTFNGNTIFNGANNFVGAVTTGDLTGNGIIKFPNLVVLPAATAINGTVVMGTDGRLYFVVGSGSNVASGSTGLAANIPFNQAETAIGFNLPFTIPAGPDAAVEIVMQMTLQPTVNPPPNYSSFLINVRLDNAALGTVIAATGVSNYETTAQLNGRATIPAGSHTLFFTITGLGLGTSTITLTSIAARVTF